MIRSLGLLAFATLALTCLGCGAKIKLEKQSEADDQETKYFIADAPSAGHKIKVEVTSDNPVNVSVYASKDVNQNDPDSMHDPKKALARATKSTNVNLEATIPGKEEFLVGVTGAGKKAKFTIKLNSQ